MGRHVHCPSPNQVTVKRGIVTVDDGRSNTVHKADARYRDLTFKILLLDPLPIARAEGRGNSFSRVTLYRSHCNICGEMRKTQNHQPPFVDRPPKQTLDRLHYRRSVYPFPQLLRCSQMPWPSNNYCMWPMSLSAQSVPSPQIRI